jgi:glycosyltransferase involved in cell wall biosynthesis
MIKNISFIVIAKDESFGIEKCLRSLADMDLNECEVICIDSGSTDDTVDMMKGYTGKIPNYRVIRSTGNCNSSMARNIGIANSTMEMIFFVDGDVELSSSFVKEASSIIQRNEADAAAGNVRDIVYADNYESVKIPVRYRQYFQKAKDVFYCGGIFIASRKIVEKVGKWDETMLRNQDIEYTLNLSRHGRLLGIPVDMCTHHTLAHQDRPARFLRNRYPVFFGMLIRRNLDRPKAIWSLMIGNRGLTAGTLIYLAAAFGLIASLVLKISYLNVLKLLFILILLDLAWCTIKKKRIPNILILHYLYPPLVLIGIFKRKEHRSSESDIEIIQ